MQENVQPRESDQKRPGQVHASRDNQDAKPLFIFVCSHTQGYAIFLAALTVDEYISKRQHSSVGNLSASLF